VHLQHATSKLRVLTDVDALVDDGEHDAFTTRYLTVTS